MIRTLLLHLLHSLDRVRRNHALEHATLQLLNRSHPQALLIGRSDRKGFLLYGAVPIEAAGLAVFGALQRLRAGEARLAIHPNCGTNLITSATLATLATALALGGARGTRQRLERMPLAILASLAALLIARPAGRLAQRYLTTQADIGGLQVLSIERLARPGPVIHRVRTSG
ncbi:MAG: DUF6391 domain-containing protein [Anaerolineales bacterium]|nr:DUF6391 domain-containing protein [Anaerolineales bacterium]